MRSIFSRIILPLVAILLFSCSGTDEPPALAVSPETLSFTATGETKTFTVTSNTTFSAVSDQTWCAVLVSGTTVTVTAEENTAITLRTATITVKTTSGAPEQTGTVMVSQAANSSISYASRFARSNIILKDGKLTFAVTEADNATIPSDVQGVFFKFGSLVAVNGKSAAAFSASDVVFSPVGYTLNITGTADAAWAGVPYFSTEGNDGENIDALIAAYPATGYNVASGKGDICRYISDQGWVVGKWRTPKASEYQALYDATSYKTGSSNGRKIGIWGTDPIIANADGTTPLTMGWFIGSGVTAATSSSSIPPENTVYFPASGYRIPTSGTFSAAGASGISWSASVNGTDYGFTLVINSISVLPILGNSRVSGFPIRCIRE